MNDCIAFCGLNCEKCEARIATVDNDDALRKKVAKLWSELNGVDITPEMINCMGCRTNGIKTVYCDSLCPIRQCALGKGVMTCGSCPEMDVCEKVGMVIRSSPEALENLKTACSGVKRALPEAMMEFYDTAFLENDEIKLVLERTADADPVRNWVPAYYFSICDKLGRRMGACDIRIGYSEGLYYGGHIGYAVDELYRGHHYAAKACTLLFLLAKKHGMQYLYITCDPDNIASRKTCEYLNGELLEIAQLPEDNDMRVNDGDTEKCVFRFSLV